MVKQKKEADKKAKELDDEDDTGINNSNAAMLLNVGDNLIFDVPNFLDLIDALENNYQIYKMQMIKKNIETGEQNGDDE